jgi:uncharacterized protein
VILSELERVGIRVLSNEHVSLQGIGAGISICGLEDSTLGAPRADLAVDGAGGTRIVLMHSPDGLRAVGDRDFDVALCGHTHGGQIKLPWGNPLVVPGGALSRRYFGGRYHLDCGGRRKLLVSHGVGCSGLPLRMFTPPEVHLCLIT